MNLKFRTATPNDSDSLAAFINAAYRGESSDKGWTTESHLLAGLRTDGADIREIMSKSDSNFLLAFDPSHPGQIIGSVHLEKRPDHHCYLGMFSVSPLVQAQGIGRTLLARAEEFARETYQSKIMEMTVISVRHELIAWYERRGYKKTGKAIPFPVHEKFGVLKVESLEMAVLSKNL